MTRIGKVRLNLTDHPGMSLHARAFQFVTENGERSLAEFQYERMIYTGPYLPGGAWSSTHVQYRRIA